MTPEEEIAYLKKELANRDGQIDTYKSQIDTVTTQLNHALEDVKAKDDQLKGYEKKERDEIEQAVHAVSKDYDCAGKDNEHLKAYLSGFTDAQKDIQAAANARTDPAVPDPKQTGTGTGKPAMSKVDAFLNA